MPFKRLENEVDAHRFNRPLTVLVTCYDFVIILSIFGLVNGGKLPFAQKVNFLISFRPITLGRQGRHQDPDQLPILTHLHFNKQKEKTQ